MNPYSRLLERVKDWCGRATYRREIAMWSYPKISLNSGWDLTDLCERTKAADQLGYDVILKATDGGLEIYYKERMPAVHWDWE